MNIYMLVEGRQTERKLYPAWLKYAVPQLSRVDKPENAIENNFYIISGSGYPSILDDHMPAAIDTINSMGKLYSRLVVVLDSDGDTPTERRNKVLKVAKNNSLLPHIELSIVVQHPCIETWLLGNRKICSQKAVSKELQECRKFYDVKVQDPELMLKPLDKIGSIANYHEYYLKCVLRDRPGKPLSYNKDHPGVTLHRYYWEKLVARHYDGDMQNFGELIKLFFTLNYDLQV